MLSRIRILLGLAVLLSGLGAVEISFGQGEKKGNSKNVTFTTADGVDLSGTLYPASGKRDAVVLLLHNFDLNKGGGSQQEGWGDLAAALQADGYVVVSFDFRGFGESKELRNKELFWKQTFNGPTNISRRGAKLPDNLDHKSFKSNYIPYMINDIAAARAYIDRLNDNKECNSSSVIVIGAGEAATLGAMWLASECRRCRDKNKNPLLGPPDIGEPESKDIAAGVFLGLSPKLGQRIAHLQRWIYEAGKTNRIPMNFIAGKNDGNGSKLATDLATAIKTGAKKDEFAQTGAKLIPDTKLAGERLLTEPETRKWIVEYLAGVMEARGARVRRERKIEETTYYYVDPKKKSLPRVIKRAGEEAPLLDPMTYITNLP